MAVRRSARREVLDGRADHPDVVSRRPAYPGEIWGFNLGRERKPKNELSTWSPQREGFRDPKQFGQIQFQD